MNDLYDIQTIRRVLWVMGGIAAAIGFGAGLFVGLHA